MPPKKPIWFLFGKILAARRINNLACCIDTELNLILVDMDKLSTISAAEQAVPGEAQLLKVNLLNDVIMNQELSPKHRNLSKEDRAAVKQEFLEQVKQTMLRDIKAKGKFNFHMVER